MNRPCPKKPQLQKVDKAASRAELELLRQKITDLIGAKPDKAAIILTDWVSRIPGRAHSHKKTG